MQTIEKNIVQEISGAVTKNRKRLMGAGVITLLFGIIGTFMSTVVTLSSMFILAIFVIFAGVLFLVESFSAPEWKGKLLNLLIAILYIVAGGVIIVNPLGSAMWFTLFISIFLIIAGLFRIVLAIKIKEEISAWGWILFGGVINIILGVLIYSEWPLSGLWVIGLFISIEMIIQGMNAIILSKTVKTVQKGIKDELE